MALQCVWGALAVDVGRNERWHGAIYALDGDVFPLFHHKARLEGQEAY